MKRNWCGVLIGTIVVLTGAAANGAGLLAPTDVTLPPLRVTQHSVDVTVRDQIALTTVQQTFQNDTSRQLEATYVFPLPENADLTDFQMSFNGKMVKGEVLPAEQARQIYESIVRQSRDPGLIEFIGRRLLQMRVFPIEPNSDTKIQVKYQQVCRPISGMSGYHYPLRTSKAGGQVYGTVRFNMRLETGAPLKNVWSPTHAVEIVREGEHKAKIAYEASKGSLDDDFMLLYDTDASDLGMSVVAFKPDSAGGSKAGHFVLTLTPKQLWPKQEYQPQDVVFVIDTSGSMSGEKIEQARAALKFCVDQLDERDAFNIVRFSTGFDLLFEQMQAASKENRAKARERIAQFTAAGGTNITDALKAALDLRPKQERPEQAGRPFVVVFVTDGMGNQPAEETLNAVKGHAGAKNARIFTFGVGHDVNTIFLDQLATSSSAKPTYVQPGENLELVLGDFFAVVSQPVLTDLKLTLPAIGVTERFPAMLGDLYHGQQLIVAGKFEEVRRGAITLTAMRSGQPVEFVWEDISFAHDAAAGFVPAIWAGRKIAYLVDQIRAHGENKEMVEEIIALSAEFGIQTPYSSWLVNPEQARVVHGRSVDMPWQRDRGGGGGGGGRGGEGMAATPARASQSRALKGQGMAIEAPVDFDDAPNLDVSTALHESSGASAVRLAYANTQLREQKARDDGGRMDQAWLMTRNINGQWYNRIGQFLVDEHFGEDTPVITVKFGSKAYFHLVNARPDLRPALAASQNAVVFTTPTQAVMVAENAGTEEFSSEQLKQIGLEVRN